MAKSTWLSTYPLYFAVGSLCAGVTLTVRAGIGHLVGDLLPGYILSMVAAYGVGTVLSYTLNRRFTFQHKGRIARQFLTFVGVSLLGMGISILASLVIREGLALAQIPFRENIAFAIALLATSVVTYTINRAITFR